MDSSGKVDEGGTDDWEDGGGSETAGSGLLMEAAVPGTEATASSDECREESSGFAIRRPPNDCERLRSPSMMGGDGRSGKRREGEGEKDGEGRTSRTSRTSDGGRTPDRARRRRDGEVSATTTTTTGQTGWRGEGEREEETVERTEERKGKSGTVQKPRRRDREDDYGGDRGGMIRRRKGEKRDEER